MEFNKNLESQPQVFPQYISAYPVEDEISLVELWIALAKFKRVFMGSFLVILVTGILVITIFKSDNYEMNTTISIGQVEGAGTIQALESPSTVISKINFSLLPNLTKKTAEENTIGLFKTNVSNPKATNLVTIQNKVSESNRDIIAGFQKTIAETILMEHQGLSRILNSKLEQALGTEKLALEKLKNPRELVKLTDLETISLHEAKLNLVKLTDEKYLQAKKAQFRERIDLFAAKIRILAEKNQALELQLDSLKVARDSPIQSAIFLDKIADNKLNINEAEENKLASESEYADFLIEIDLKAAKQAVMVDTTESKIKLIESNWKSDIQEKENKIVELENQLEGNYTRIINQSELSLEPVGLTQNLAYMLNVVLALFAAFFITLIAMFQAKVKEKLATEK